MVYVVAKSYWEGVPYSKSKYRSNVRKTAFSACNVNAKPQFRVYMMHDLGALRRARPTAIAVPLVNVYDVISRLFPNCLRPSAIDFSHS